MCSFAGRAAVLAKALDESESDARPSVEVEATCIDGKFADELRAKREEVAAREAATIARSAELNAIASHIEKRIEELKSLSRSIEDSAAKRDSVRNEEAKRVAAIYAQMKPQTAGGIIDGMDPEFAAGLLLAMEGESASAIIATLEPKRAYAITVLMTR